MVKHSPIPHEDRVWRMIVRVFCIVGAAYLILPSLVVIPLSFTSGDLLTYPLPGLSLKYYKEFFTSSLWLPASKNSIMVALAVTFISGVLGIPAAIGLARLRSRLRAPLLLFIAAPLAMPSVILAVAFFLFYSLLDMTGTLISLILAHTVLAVPFVVLVVGAALQGYDYNLNRAAASLGARPLLVFRKVTLPIMAPGIMTAALFAFVTSFDELIVALFLSGPRQYTLPRQIYSGVRDSINPTIAVVATLLIAAAIAFVALVEWLRRRSNRQNVAWTAV